MRNQLNTQEMFILTHNEGYKILAVYKNGEGWYNPYGIKLKDDCWNGFERIS